MGQAPRGQMPMQNMADRPMQPNQQNQTQSQSHQLQSIIMSQLNQNHPQNTRQGWRTAVGVQERANKIRQMQVFRRVFIGYTTSS
jgi:hypothetical protein